MKKILVYLLLLISVTVHAQNVKYYINQNTPANGGGNDANSGLSPASAWKTIAKANTIAFKAGDQILLFSEGPWHNGSFFLDQNDIGTPANPITISCYGANNRANVWAGSDQGFYGANNGSIVIKNINFYGGRTFGGGNNANGIYFYTDGGTTHRPYIFIDSCRLEGFGQQGILILSWNPDAARAKGFSDITIKNSIITNCVRSGINIGGFDAFGQAFVHKNVLIENVRATQNAGEFGFTAFATGNGIVVSSVDGAMINKCVADYNGFLNSHVGGGAAGIWYYNTKNGIIQNCESFGNYAGLSLDGNGFGIDGGCQNCVIQYCYSHDNEGCGYGLFEYGSENNFNNNTVRFNISQNDGRKNSFGAIKLWGVDGLHKLNNSNVYNNSIYLNADNLVDNAELPVGVRVLGNNMNNVKIMNNAFYLANSSLSFTRTVSLINTPLNILPAEVLMLNNMYHKTSGAINFGWGDNYPTLAVWRTATSQERNGGMDYGYLLNPGFTSPGAGGAIAGYPPNGNNQTIPPPGDVATLNQYKLVAGANAIGKGINLNTLFGINVGARDYFGTTLVDVTNFDIGSHQTIPVLPLASLKSFTVQSESGVNTIVWTMNNLQNIQKFEVESSRNGTQFAIVGKSIFTNGSLKYSITDLSAGGTVYYRLKGTDSDGSVWYSRIVTASENMKTRLMISPNPVNIMCNISVLWAKQESVNLSIIQSNGQVVMAKQVLLNKGNNSFTINDFSTLSKGSYIIKLTGSESTATKQVIKQ